MNNYPIRILNTTTQKWVKSQGKSIIKLHAAPEAEQFYRRLGYDNMEFNDVSIGENNIDLGKLL